MKKYSLIISLLMLFSLLSQAQRTSNRVQFPSYYTLDWMLTHPMGCFTSTNISLDKIDPKLSSEKLFDRMEFQVIEDDRLEYVGWQENMHYQSKLKNTPQPLRIMVGCIYDSSDLEHIIEWSYFLKYTDSRTAKRVAQDMCNQLAKTYKKLETTDNSVTFIKIQGIGKINKVVVSWDKSVFVTIE